MFKTVALCHSTDVIKHLGYNYIWRHDMVKDTENKELSKFFQIFKNTNKILNTGRCNFESYAWRPYNVGMSLFQVFSRIILVMFLL